ncbi:MAG: SusC/RagA family TonB-linked outer membrane protein [Fermentimonas sp.]|jgi:TonB-linked SusC/RagA family outer membrane protein
MKKSKEMFSRRKNLSIANVFFLLFLFISSPLSATDESSHMSDDRLHESQQNFTVKGVVVDESANPLPGVTILIEGSTRGVTTDTDGSYYIDVKPNDRLIFSFIGLETQSIDVAGRTVINIVMKEQAEMLEEVQIVAFGKQKKESVISSISTVRPAELKIPSSNLTTALAGRMSGVISYQRSGEPGRDDADFFIRGVTSFGYSARPLILLDGLEVSSSDLARLQPDDIASFSIMKDATATSLYGARGANGVILITTKEGKEGKAKTSFRYETSISSPTDKVELADPITYMRLGNEAIKTRDPLGAIRYSREKIDKTKQGLHPLKYPATDWYSLLFNDYTLNHRFNFNVSGGGKIARYYLAATYNRDNGNLKVDKMNNFNSNIQLNRFLLRSNVNIDITPTTEVVVRLYGTFDNLTGPVDGGEQIYNKVMRTNPVLYPAYYLPNEALRHTQHILFGNFEEGGYLNPYADMVKGYQESTSSKMIAQFEAHQDLEFLLDGLSIRGLYSTTRYSSFGFHRFYNPFYYSLGGYDEATGDYSLYKINPLQGTEFLNYSETAKNVNADTYMEFAANYENTFSDDHTLGAMVVSYLSNYLEGNAGNLQRSLPHRNMGISGRATYSYDSRYFIEGNFGYNGSERFSKKYRFGFFPSLGLGWIISNEKFWSDSMSKVFPMVKLKVTDGLVGNDAIGSADDRFFYISQVNIGGGSGYVFGSDFGYSRPGITISRYENPEITWEVSRKTNLGLEINLLSMFDINVDIYKEYRKNILMTRTYVPTTMGLQAPSRANVGEAKGGGVDFSIDFNKSFSPDFWMSGRVNFTYAASKYVKVDEPDYSATPWRSMVGQKIGQTWGYVAERLFVDDNEVKNSPYQSADALGGDIKYRDINNDGVIDDFDRVPIGYPTYPEIIYGAGLSTGYKGLDFSFFFQGLARESFWINTSETAPFVSNQQLLKVYADNHWSESNRDLYAIWPRLSNITIQNNNRVSTWFMQDGSFLRLKSVELGYSIPQKMSNKLLMENLRLYCSGTNLLTFSKFKLWDPEMAGKGLGYPIQKVINFGLQISF